MGGGGKKHGLELRRQRTVGVGNLQFVFEVAHGSQTTQDQINAVIPGTLNGETVEADHLNTLEMGRGCADLSKTLFKRKRGRFAGVLENSNHHLPEQSAPPLNQVQVTKG